ncbi:hypothetical protein DDB_G0293352 [Dictyostelium discoideum AX4]|uniref:Uncharacterized protein n=1 Tax=Dictyostelium discoideum TaxID=44689 RepID=Q54BX8_DICDI|nr:hypothetical protein DDB_G0293352 [Dictyostelium discoideum AX4]EAL60765.1 hypothetical protein DDB_G0293352 [Dictyostelium discoideum AX4]|eukprot:XP_629178.1 hypothetical protein DDB_G0293352 [Dictyostelium discoideum AX4]
MEHHSKDPNLRSKFPFYLNSSVYKVLNGTTHVAIAPSTKTIKTGSIPTSVQALLLLDGFNVELTEGMLPQSIISIDITRASDIFYIDKSSSGRSNFNINNLLDSIPSTHDTDKGELSHVNKKAMVSSVQLLIQSN